MKINHLRNATLIVEFANKRFLVDPMLGEKGSFSAFPNAPRENENNPLVDLPISVDLILSNIDAVILTHLHLDHFDEAAQQLIPKDMHIFVQNNEDAQQIKQIGFNKVEVLTENTQFEDIQLIKTSGEHGRGEILNYTGPVCGVIFKHNSEKTLYVAGDTIWYSKVRTTIDSCKPDVIVVNGGDNQFYEGGSLVMNKFDIYQTAKAAPNSKIIVVHMEAVNHWNLSRNELKTFIKEKNIESQVLVPNDGDTYNFK
ncbi:MBL fold metallo-hydrolase [Staphylococcus sp. KG4-3]|uniref:MBL fold metallo-hydrolase n=2 Tax=Staphylococcus xylosus TaxID=1288 RepID=A0A418IJS3_STAXY|nr:MBL fold metallo-hydrolase [Staphylococcus xylosus]RIN06444.1 MBL fold metallo-hydrolase [Staphylococcus xylosus]